MACVTLTWSSCGQTLESKSIGLGEACSIYIANTYPLVFPYRNGLFKGGRGVVKCPKSQAHVWGG